MPDDQAPSMTADELQTAIDKTPAAKVRKEQITARIAEFSFTRLSHTVTICNIVLDNGFSVRGESACVSPENYNREIGEQIAYDNAFNQLWQFFGFMLAEDRMRTRIVTEIGPNIGYYHRIAQICHAVNKAWCEYQGDDSQPDWTNAPQWQQKSAENGVIFHINNPNAGDNASHDSWMAEKLAGGWVYGEIKNPDASPPTHPCIVPFDQLPREQQFKDRLFRTVVHAALNTA